MTKWEDKIFEVDAICIYVCMLWNSARGELVNSINLFEKEENITLHGYVCLKNQQQTRKAD